MLDDVMARRRALPTGMAGDPVLSHSSGALEDYGKRMPPGYGHSVAAYELVPYEGRKKPCY